MKSHTGLCILPSCRDQSKLWSQYQLFIHSFIHQTYINCLPCWRPWARCPGCRVQSSEGLPTALDSCNLVRDACACTGVIPKWCAQDKVLYPANENSEGIPGLGSQKSLCHKRQTSKPSTMAASLPPNKPTCWIIALYQSKTFYK